MTDENKKITSKTFLKMKSEGKKISMLTSYDYSTARYADEAGIDSILIGDSLGMTVLGYDDTVKVTIEDMIIFTSAVARGVKHALIVADMPFMSFQISKEETLKNAAKLIRAGANAVKIEGGSDFVVEQISALTQAGILAVAHLGFTPQYINTIGGYFIQGKSYENTLKLLEAAKKLEKAGVFALVLELMPEEAAEYITKNLNIPTIGIGAGRLCDGQVLVVDDVLGRYHGKIPKFAKQYTNLKEIIKSAVSSYNSDVKSCKFPTEENVFNLKKEEKDKFGSSLIN